MYQNQEQLRRWTEALTRRDAIDPGLYDQYGVKRGLRDKNGKGVLAGLTGVSSVVGKQLVDGQEVPCEGDLYYRGYSIRDLARGQASEKNVLAEECAYLLLFGDLPTAAELEEFRLTPGQGPHPAPEFHPGRDHEGPLGRHYEHPDPQRSDPFSL